MNNKIKRSSTFKILIFIFWTLIGVVLSGPFHEFGHCVFYWIQGVPASMSLTKEFPLRDISTNQYALGSFGGILFSWLAIILLFSLQNFLTKKNKKGETVFQALFMGQVMIGLIYMLEFVLKGDSPGELLSAEKLIHLPRNSLTWFTFVLALMFLFVFLKKSRIRIGLKQVMFFLLLFLLSVICVIILGELDKKLWQKFPIVKIGDAMIYNEPLQKVRKK